MSGELQLHDFDGDARCAHCGAAAVGPCARCDRPVCGDCCVLTEGGARVYAICIGCDGRGGRSLKAGWVAVIDLAGSSPAGAPRRGGAPFLAGPLLIEEPSNIPPAPMASIPPDLIGITIAGKYRIERLVGGGAMGSVWAAKHTTLGNSVAIKFIHPKLAAGKETARRFETEARAAAKLKSRHAVQVYDYGTTPDGQPYIVMEFLEGKTLRPGHLGWRGAPCGGGHRDHLPGRTGARCRAPGGGDPP